jgi:phenylpropionate dioxygenase-like ring-hydroxylating dioxygenase large terminal subunit
MAGPYNYHGNPFRTVENFLDAAHFPFVHANINGDPDNPEPIGDYEVFADENGVRTGPIPRYQPLGDHRGIPITAYYQYSCPRPLSAYFAKDTGEGNRFCTFMAVTPLAIDDCILWVQIAINYGFDLPEPQILERQDAVYNQDKPIIESQRPHPLPLDLKRELHLRSDKYCVAYRKWLKELGITWGVSQ